MTRTPSRRGGITLYEVVLSLAILLGSLTVIGQLIATGSRAASQARMRTQALIICQTQMAEVVAGGTQLMTPVENAELEATESGTWVWSMQFVGGQSTAATGGLGGLTVVDAAAAQSTAPPHADLIRIDVTVSRLSPDRTVEVSETISRFVRNPQLYVDAANEAALLESEAAAAETAE